MFRRCCQKRDSNGVCPRGSAAFLLGANRCPSDPSNPKGCPLLTATFPVLQGWLTESARLIAKSGRTVEWVTPLGLPIIQPYHRAKTTLVSGAGGAGRRGLVGSLVEWECAKARQGVTSHPTVHNSNTLLGALDHSWRRPVEDGPSGCVTATCLVTLLRSQGPVPLSCLSRVG